MFAQGYIIYFILFFCSQGYFQKPHRKERYCGYTSSMAEKRICFLQRFLHIPFHTPIFRNREIRNRRKPVFSWIRDRDVYYQNQIRAFVETIVSFLLGAIWNPLSQFTLDKSRYHWALLSYLPLQRRCVFWIHFYLKTCHWTRRNLGYSCRNNSLLLSKKDFFYIFIISYFIYSLNCCILK